MEDCNICYTQIQKTNEVTLSCQHKLCNSCYLRLANQLCPYCRTPFKYSAEDIKKRQAMNIKYNNYTPPAQLFDESILNSFNQLEINTENNTHNPPFSRLLRNKNRKRRRDLSEEEIKERRNIIRKKCKRKWMIKEGRLNKINWFDIIL